MLQAKTFPRMCKGKENSWRMALWNENQTEPKGNEKQARGESVGLLPLIFQGKHIKTQLKPTFFRLLFTFYDELSDLKILKHQPEHVDHG